MLLERQFRIYGSVYNRMYVFAVTTLMTLRPMSVSEPAMSGNEKTSDYTLERSFDQYQKANCLMGKIQRILPVLPYQKTNFSCRDRRNRTPVMVAALKGQVKMFDFLVRMGCDLSAVSFDNENVLHFASRGGNADIVRKILVNNWCDLESRDDNGRTPILIAARYGCKEVFELLMKNGCEMTAVDDNKNNILHLACISCNVGLVQRILSLNIISIESTGENGWTPLMTAVRHGHRGLFDFLRERGCNLMVVDNENNSILHLAVMLDNICPTQYIIAKRVVSYGTTPKEGKRVLTALRCCLDEVFDVLKGRGCNVTFVCTDADNIHYLACCNSKSMYTHLTEMKDVRGMEDMKNINGFTPKQLADQLVYTDWVPFNSVVVMQC